MKEGRITILPNYDYVNIEIEDHESGEILFRSKLNTEQYMRILSRQSSVKCHYEYGDLSHIGKKMEVSKLEFRLPDQQIEFGLRHEDHIQSLYLESLRHCKDGWKPDKYYNSRDSFFDKDGEMWARCTIRRWV